jgi:hypothetical protein
MRLANHVTRRKDEKCIKHLVRNLKRSDYLEELGVDGRIILEWISVGK